MKDRGDSFQLESRIEREVGENRPGLLLFSIGGVPDGQSLEIEEKQPVGLLTQKPSRGFWKLKIVSVARLK